MSKETLELMLCLDRKEMETQTALQCAPLLTGVKISNLLTVDQSCHIQTARLFPVFCSVNQMERLCTFYTGRSS